MARRLLDADAGREARRQGLLLDRLATQFRRKIERELSAAMLGVLSHIEKGGAGELPQGFADKIEAIYAQMVAASITAFGGRILDQGKSAGLILEAKFDFGQLMRRLALRYIGLEAVRKRIRGVVETTRRQIINAVQSGYRQGSTLPEIASSIREVVPAIASHRANVIARTETHGAANFGSVESAKETGLPLRKEWLAAKDDRTRSIEARDPDQFGHLQADGQKVGMDEPFLIPRLGGGVEPLMYPGDPSGSPASTVNCRCVTGYIVDDGI